MCVREMLVEERDVRMNAILRTRSESSASILVTQQLCQFLESVLRHGLRSRPMGSGESEKVSLLLLSSGSIRAQRPYSSDALTLRASVSQMVMFRRKRGY